MSTMSSKTTRETFSQLSKIIFIMSIHLVFSYSFTAAETNQNEESLIYALKNRNALLETRETAADQLVKHFSDTAGPALVSILENPNELRALQSYISNSIASSKNHRLLDHISRTLQNRKESAYVREIALYTLWKSGPDTGREAARQIVQDSYEELPFRMKALSYLKTNPDDAEARKVMSQIFSDKSEAKELRQEALKFLESGKNQDDVKNVLAEMVTDSSEDTGFRQLAIQKSGSLKSDTLNQNLLKIISNPRESKESQELALHALTDQKAELMDLLPKLKQTFRLLPNGPIKIAFKKLITDVETLQKLKEDSRTDSPKK